MSVMVWKLLLLQLLLLRAVPTSQDRKTNVMLAYKPNGHFCEEHSECYSNCCIRTGDSPNRFCSAKSIFLQCVSWRKVSMEQGNSIAEECGGENMNKAVVEITLVSFFKKMVQGQDVS
ncbi:hypothetical protein U0070_017981 [Myodes glareolus]|uniref:Uncharacterized protein n=1 Tax=Myodes glareolus TaxID=447135 RepID=A0AAW0HWM9_MYOGA